MRGVDRQDLYALQAYTSTFEAPNAIPGYPAISEDLPLEERNSPWRTSNCTLSFLTLPTERESFVAKLAQRLRGSDASR